VTGMQVARIKLSGKDPKELDSICSEIKEIAKKFGINYRGPIPLPTKILKVVTLKTPCGDGTGHGNATFDKWEMRIHKRLIEVQADERALKQIMRVNIPTNVHIEIKLIG
jgi:ribosomal protein uS10